MEELEHIKIFQRSQEEDNIKTLTVFLSAFILTTAVTISILAGCKAYAGNQ